MRRASATRSIASAPAALAGGRRRAGGDDPATEAAETELDLVEALARRVREEPGAFADAAALATTAGLGTARLERLVRLHLHATPAALLAEARVEALRRGLLAGRRRFPDLARDAGWPSAVEAGAAFRAATGMTPDDYRRLGRRAIRGGGGSGELAFALPAGYRPEPTLRFLGRDPQSPCERTAGAAAFRKTVRLPGGPALLTVEIAAGAALCRIERRAAPAAPASGGPAGGDLAAAHGIARRLLGLAGGAADPAVFERRARRLGAGRLVAGREGLRIPLAAEPFEGLVWAILGQQVNLAFAAALRRRLIDLCGERLNAGDGTAWIAHPTPAAVAALAPEDLLPLQLSRRKAEYLIGAAREVAAGALPLDQLAAGSATRAERRLLAIRGLGPWTAAYVMLRALGFADCLPVGDSGLAAGLSRFFSLDHRPDAAETRALAVPFSPYRSLATAHLWASLGDPPT